MLARFFSRREALAFAALLSFHLLLPVALARWSVQIPDEDVYTGLAKNIATLGRFVLDFGAFHHAAFTPYTYVAPGWPAWLALGYLVGGVAGMWIMLGLAWCLALILAELLARVLKLTRAARWGLLGWLTTNPLLLYYHSHEMTEAMALALGLGLVALGIAWLERPTWRTLLLLAIVSGLGRLTRSALVIPVAAIAIVAIATVRPWSRLLRMGLVFVVVQTAVVAPWLVRMHEVGAGMTSTELKLGVNLFIYNNVHVDNPYNVRPDESFQEPAGLDDMTPAARDKLLTRLGIEGIAQQPSKYIRNCARRVGYLLSPLPNFSESGKLKAIALALTTLIYLYGFWAAFGIAEGLGAGLSRAEWVLLLSVVFWYAFHIAFHASVRQRIPSDPWIAALALAVWSRRYGVGPAKPIQE